MCGNRLIHRGEVCSEYDIKTGEKCRSEIQPQPFYGNFLKLQVLPAVKNFRNRTGKPEHHQINQAGQHSDRNNAIAQHFPAALLLVISTGPADQRLDSLSDPGKDRQHHQRKVGNHPISCDSHVALQIQNNCIKNDDHNSGGNLRD